MVRPALLVASLGALLAGVSPAAAVQGQLDPFFGSAGVVTTAIGGIAVAEDVLVQPDGRIVAVGVAGSDAAVVRYQQNGILDPSFGAGGIVTTSFSAGQDVAEAVLLEPDGSIVVACSTAADVALARYHGDGSLDGTFGTGGIVVTDVAGEPDRAVAAARQPDGKLVVAGVATVGGEHHILVLRYDPSGSPDASFGTGGVVVTDLGTPTEEVRALVLQPDGKIVVAGWARPAAGSDVLLIRYEPSGVLDGSFGIGGVVVTDLGGDEAADALVQQADGKLLVAGQTGQRALVARYDDTGVLDATFGSGGIQTISFGLERDFAQAVVMQADGKILVAGYTLQGTTFEDIRFRFALVRLLQEGGVDAGFSAFAGSAIPGFATSLAREPGGSVIVAGMTSLQPPVPLTINFALARVLTGEFCGNGTIEAAERCDDGNAANGDCCSDVCRLDTRLTPCQSDGNPCTLDTCDDLGTCMHRPLTFQPCNDGKACTANDQCTAEGLCIGIPVFVNEFCARCDPTTGAVVRGPRTDCKHTTRPKASFLELADAPHDEDDRVLWRWTKGEATSVAELGDPFQSLLDPHELCIFDESGPAPGLLFATLAEPEGLPLCAHPPCWRRKGPDEFVYRSRPANPFGVELLAVRAGPEGRPRATVRARGDRLVLPPLPFALPLRVQLGARDGGCWEATYSAVGVKRNDAQRFKGRSD